MALGATPNWNAVPWDYPGSGGFNAALRFYGNEMFGPYNSGAGDLAASPVADAAVGRYYSDPTVSADSGGAGQEATQGRFGRLVQGLSSARSAGNTARSNALVAGGQGVNQVAGAAGSDIEQNIAAHVALQNAKTKSLGGNLGLAMGAISDLANPTGNLSNIYNSVSGNKSSGLSQILSSVGNEFPNINTVKSSFSSLMPGNIGSSFGPSMPMDAGSGPSSSPTTGLSPVSGIGSTLLEGDIGPSSAGTFSGAVGAAGAGADAAGGAAVGAGAAEGAGAAAPAAAGAVDAGGTAAAGGFSSLVAMLPDLFAFL
jgi:hypothetical protein